MASNMQSPGGKSFPCRTPVSNALDATASDVTIYAASEFFLMDPSMLGWSFACLLVPSSMWWP
jgi:hypothetical protein